MIFTPEKMWQCAVEQMGTEHHGWKVDTQVIMLYNGQDVAELYKALRKAHKTHIMEVEWNSPCVKLP